MTFYPNLDSFLIVHFVDGTRKIWRIASGPCERVSERHHTERAPLVEKLTRNIRLLKNQSAANVIKTIMKHFPAAEEISAVHEDDRLEANRLCDLGEVFEGQFEEYGGKWAYYASMTLRRAENNEYIHPDGSLDRFVNCITGEKYPTPGEGERAWRISYVYKGGVSGCDHHQIIIAAEPRDAIEKLLAIHEQQFAENGNMAGFFGDACKRENLLSATAEDIATGQYFWFSGPDLAEDANAKAMTNLFSAMASDDPDAALGALLSGMGRDCREPNGSQS